MTGPAVDRDFAPYYPGISNTENLRDWDPPFPIDLRRIRDVDEAYWRQYRTAPKAFVPESFGRAFWGSRYGAATSIRIDPGPGLPDFVKTLQGKIDPIALGIAVRDVRTDALGASRGATDFGEYFTYFSFFLVVSALILTALFFKLGVEQRIREVGLLRAVGFSTPAVRRLFGVRRPGARGGRQRHRHDRRGRLRAAADDRPAHLVGGRRRHHGADAARDSPVARRRRARRDCRGGRVHLVDAPRALRESRSERCSQERSETTRNLELGIRNWECVPNLRRGILNSKFLILNCAAAAVLLLILGSAGDDWQRRRVLRRRRAASRRRARGRRMVVEASAPHDPVGSRLVVDVPARHAQRVLPAGAERARDLGDGGGDVHPDLGRRLPPRRHDRLVEPPLGDRRLSAAGRNDAAARQRSQQRGWPRAARPRREQRHRRSSPSACCPATMRAA